MPVPSSISQLSQTPGMNFPSGSESPSLLDNYDRQYAAFIAMLRDGQGFSTPLDLASAATTDIGAQPSMFLRITGTTTITSFGTNYNGPRFVVFGGALTLTHNATSLILPRGRNITTAAGDCAVVIPNAATPTGWRVFAYQWAEAQTDDVGEVKGFFRNTAPLGYLKANGAAVLIATYPELAAAIYVGDAANATAVAGYRCTNPASPSSTRNIAGTYIVLPDFRGEFPRGWDDGRGVDTGRAWASAQASQNLSHAHSGTANTTSLTGSVTHRESGPISASGIMALGGITTQFDGGGGYTGSQSFSINATHSHTLAINNDGGTEARSRNVTLLFCIKY